MLPDQIGKVTALTESVLLGDKLLVHRLLVGILLDEKGTAGRDYNFCTVVVRFDAGRARHSAVVATVLLLLQLFEDLDARLLDLLGLIR